MGEAKVRKANNPAHYALDFIMPCSAYFNQRWVGKSKSSDEFVKWYDGLTLTQSVSVSGAIDLLEEAGPALGRPDVDTIKGSSIPNLKELRIQHAGKPLRILFAFDPRRVGYLIIGDDKTGDNRLYEKFVPVAENIYKQHLREIKGKREK